ncbi:unnamed protein product [Heligmosomoides polygyrus]|uniref:Uncharacterized protein n=1 Tax=Heligmosomoides polygyrus TaxID=6339 RepID=A0A183F901_HELPZ|nr:unnamed protein product [Heligmosomoides polygyrus]
MAAGGSLKLSISLSRGISSTSENSQIIIDEKMDETESKCGTDRPNANAREEPCIVAESSAKRSDLLNVKIPTGTKAQKRRRIQSVCFTNGPKVTRY